MESIAVYQIYSSFKVTGRGIVLIGKILEGQIISNDVFIEFEFDKQILKRRIKEIDEAIRISAKKSGLGILIEISDEEESINLSNWGPNHTIGKIYINR